MENNTFKGSLFGGFNREDVIDYIKKTSAESTARIESLEGDIDKLCAQEQELRTQVSTLQRNLKSKGYYKGKIDGKFGQKTRSAVYRYQKAIGLTADGKPGNKTLTALYDGISALNTIDGKKKA